MNPEEYAQLMRLGESHWWFVGTRDLIFSCVRPDSLPDKPILDVGCGPGLMLRRFSDIGPIFGIDHNAGALEHCRNIGFPGLARADAAALPFRPNAFGLVIAADLLEHCGDDEAVLGELYRVAAPHGVLLASVPAYGWLWSSHDAALHHKRRYSKSGLVRIVEAAGFTVSRVSFFNTMLFAPVALMRLTLGKIRQHSSGNKIRYYENLRLLNRILLGAMQLEGRLISRMNLPFGLSILLLASKE
jgi:ubiquinone/menaquinone biosynthesis C-methylase UbiE